MKVVPLKFPRLTKVANVDAGTLVEMFDSHLCSKGLFIVMAQTAYQNLHDGNAPLQSNPGASPFGGPPPLPPPVAWDTISLDSQRRLLDPNSGIIWLVNKSMRCATFPRRFHR